MDGLAFWRANGWLSRVVTAREGRGVGNGWLTSFVLKIGGIGARSSSVGPDGLHRTWCGRYDYRWTVVLGGTVPTDRQRH